MPALQTLAGVERNRVVRLIRETARAAARYESKHAKLFHNKVARLDEDETQLSSPCT